MNKERRNELLREAMRLQNELTAVLIMLSPDLKNTPENKKVGGQMNHLQEAKNRINKEDYRDRTERDIEEAKVHALIAIAEQLDKMNDFERLNNTEFTTKWEEQ